MPHVASDVKSQMLARSLPQAARQTYASVSQATTPFDSILDQTEQPAPAPRPQRAADDNSPRSARADRSGRSEPADRPDRAAQSDDSSKPADTKNAAKSDAKTDATDGKSAADSPKTPEKTADSAGTDAKSADPAAKGDDLKAAADAAALAGAVQPAVATTVAPVAVVIDPALAAAAVQADAKGTASAETKTDTTAITAAATATATVAQQAAQSDEASGDTAQTKASPDALAALAELAAKADKVEVKADAKTDKKAATDKPALAAKVAGKEPAPQQAEATAPATGDEPHKDTGAHARAEETANTHRGAAPDNAATVTDSTAATAAPKAPDLTPPPATNVQAVAPSTQTTAVAAPAAATQTLATDRAVPISGVAFEITNKALAGKGQFDIRLDPPDLGRIHVRLDVDRDGNVITHMVADRTDTLDMLRKDTAGLERALQDAGLKTSDNSLQFSLRDQSSNQQQSNSGPNNTAHIVVSDEQAVPNEPAQRNYARYNAPTGGLDIRV